MSYNLSQIAGDWHQVACREFGHKLGCISIGAGYLELISWILCLSALARRLTMERRSSERIRPFLSIYFFQLAATRASPLQSASISSIFAKLIQYLLKRLVLGDDDAKDRTKDAADSVCCDSRVLMLQQLKVKTICLFKNEHLPAFRE